MPTTVTAPRWAQPGPSDQSNSDTIYWAGYILPFFNASPVMKPNTTVIYTRRNCPFCTKIKKVYDAKGWTYAELVLDENYTRDQFWSEFGRSATFPQLIVDGKKTGGCNETISEFRSKGWV